ncbi:hypothetical protein RJ640_005430 [Escallonia rubra]|uniref:GST N-terminal domain-containing protein n=1 Tax=Escallonia rubra TaxID=112253 RepID=A0AA88U2P3_9ASTE|nr:hypothetical protein RJ640_005430 [Escallonia rubra]
MLTCSSSLYPSNLPLIPHSHGLSSLLTISIPASPSFLPRNKNRSASSLRSNRIRAKKSSADDVQFPLQNDTTNPSTATSFLSLLCPLLKLFSGGDPSRDRSYMLEVVTSSLSTLARLPWGSRSLSSSLDSQDTIRVDPPMRLQLFEFEACPFCRRVREAITELDLSVEVYPCPKGSVRHREVVRRIGGKEQFPFLVDPNTGISTYESSEIVNYLFQQYGEGKSPSFGLLESTLLTGWVPTLLRAGRGMTLWEKAITEPPTEKLELFSFHISFKMWGKDRHGSSYFFRRREIPYMIDPNTGTQIGDYEKILSYLFQTYSTASV